MRPGFEPIFPNIAEDFLACQRLLTTIGNALDALVHRRMTEQLHSATELEIINDPQQTRITFEDGSRITFPEARAEFAIERTRGIEATGCKGNVGLRLKFEGTDEGIFLPLAQLVP